MTRVVRREVDSLQRSVQATRDATSRTLDELRGELVELRTALEASDRELAAAVGSLHEAQDELGVCRSAVADLVRFRDEDATTMTVVEGRTRELSATVESLRCSVELLLGPTGRHVSRLVTDDDVDGLVDDFDFVGDRARVAVSLHIAYRTLVELELRCLGRFDGSTANIMAKLAAVTVLPPPNGEILQIGTSFGIDAAAFARQVSRTGADARLTLVDPMAGQDPRARADRDVSLCAVTPSVVEANLALGGVDERRYRLVPGRSDDRDVRAAVSDRRYGLIVIAGQSSREATEDDLTWAESVAEPGALVLLDDVGGPESPGRAATVQAYADRPSSALRMVGAASTSAFLRAERSVEAG